MVELFKTLRDGNVNPRKVLKNQNNFKPDLDKIRKRYPKSRSEDQRNLIQNVENFFDLKEKIIEFFKDFFFLLLEAKYKVNIKKDSKYI